MPFVTELVVTVTHCTRSIFSLRQDGEHGFLRAERHPVRVVPGAVLFPGGVPVSERVMRHAHGRPHPALRARDWMSPDRPQETGGPHPGLPEQYTHVGLVQEV